MRGTCGASSRCGVGLQDVRLRVREVPGGGEGRHAEGRPDLVPPGGLEPDDLVLPAFPLEHLHVARRQPRDQGGGDGRVHQPVAGEAAGVHQPTHVPVPADDGRVIRGVPVEPARHGDALVLRGHQAWSELPHLVYHEVAVGRAALAVVGAEAWLDSVLVLRAELRLGVRVVCPPRHQGARVRTAVCHPTRTHPVDGHGQVTPGLLAQLSRVRGEGEVALERVDGQGHAPHRTAQARPPGVGGVDHHVPFHKTAVSQEYPLDLAASELGSHHLGVLQHLDPELSRAAEAERVDQVMLEEPVRGAPGGVADPPHLVPTEVRPAPHDLVHVQDLHGQTQLLLHADLDLDLGPGLRRLATPLVHPAFDRVDRLPQEQVAVGDQDVLALVLRRAQVLVDVRVPVLAVDHAEHRLRLPELGTNAGRRAAAGPVPDPVRLQDRDLEPLLRQRDRAERASGTATYDDDVATRRQRVCFRHLDLPGA